MSINVAKIMHRTVCTLCCAMLALHFDLWWLIFMAIPIGLLTGFIVIDVETTNDE